MKTLAAIAVIIFVWAAYQLLTPNLSTSVVVFLVVAYSCWRRQWPAGAVVVLGGGTLLADLALPQVWPHYLTTSLIAGTSYLAVVAPNLSVSNTPGNAIGLLLWLALWRAVYLAQLFTSAMFQRTALPAPAQIASLGIRWIISGLAIWCLLELASVVGKRLVQRRKRPSASYGQ